MSNRLLLAITLTMLGLFSYAQDTTRFQGLFHDAKVSGYWRNYYMGTINRDSLTDFYTLSTGGKLKLESGTYKGFSFGVSYFTSIFTGIGNQDVIDSATGAPNRYELGNYDINDPNNHEIHLLGEAYLRYQKNDWTLDIGRFGRKTTMLNGQDGRMIPTLFQGIWLSNKSKGKWSGEAAILNAIAPRSTSQWFSIGRSFQYPQGRNVDGSPSDYQGNIASDFIAIGRIQYKPVKGLQLSVLNYYVDNVFNTTISEVRYARKGDQWNTEVGFKQIHQFKVNDGGNADQTKTYFYHDQSNIFEMELIAKRNDYTFRLAGTRITDDGRFLFPRAWGREFLYTFQKRERSEGFGDQWNFLGFVAKDWSLKNGDKVSASLGHGYYLRPNPTEAELNKYGIPANSQTDLDIFYHFGKALRGLQIEFLVVYKQGLNEDDYLFNPRFVHQKVDMLNYQIIMNYKF